MSIENGISSRLMAGGTPAYVQSFGLKAGVVVLSRLSNPPGHQRGAWGKYGSSVTTHARGEVYGKL